MLLQHTDTCSDTGAATAAAIECRICSSSTPPFLQLCFGTGWLLFVCVSQESSERNLFYMLQSLKISIPTGSKKTCSALAAFCSLEVEFLRFQATCRQHRGCIIPQAVTHSLALLNMGVIIARKMLSWLDLLINRYCSM